MRIEKYFFKIHNIVLSALDSVDVAICKLQKSIFLTWSKEKVEKLRWIEYIDKDVFTALTYLGFHLKHKVIK